jgi:hypothetical protein
LLLRNVRRSFVTVKCSGGDLNPHAFRHTPLKRTCLPFHHPSASGKGSLPLRDRRARQKFPLKANRPYEILAGSDEGDSSWHTQWFRQEESNTVLRKVM